jgi:hypothetical protein
VGLSADLTDDSFEWIVRADPLPTFAHSPQQLNNATSPAGASHARENQNLQNELLEAKHGNWMGFRTADAGNGADLAMAAVGQINRPKNTGG